MRLVCPCKILAGLHGATELTEAHSLPYTKRISLLGTLSIANPSADKARRAVQAQKQKELQHQLEEQVLEVEQRHKYEVAQDLVAARALEEDACKWREAQAEKQAQKKIVMLQLKVGHTSRHMPSVEGPKLPPMRDYMLA